MNLGTGRLGRITVEYTYAWAENWPGSQAYMSLKRHDCVIELESAGTLTKVISNCGIVWVYTSSIEYTKKHGNTRN